MKDIRQDTKDLLNILCDGILIIDSNFKVVFANDTLLQQCSYRREDVIGQSCHVFSHNCPTPCSEILSGIGKSELICPHRNVFKAGEPISVIHTHTFPDGRERIFDITASPVSDENGRVIYMIEVLRDITEKKNAELKIKEREAFLSSLLEGIGDGVVVIDRDFRIISANNGYLKQTKSTLNEVLGRYCYEVSHHIDKPCYLSGEKCSVKNTFDTGMSHRIIHTHFDRDNNPIYVETISYPLKDSHGDINLAVEVIADVTEKVKLDIELKQRVKELEDFYDMAVGREVKMAELKEEIEKLRIELNKYRK